MLNIGVRLAELLRVHVREKQASRKPRFCSVIPNTM